MSTNHAQSSVSLEQALALAQQLSDSDKARLIAQLATELGHSPSGTSPTARRFLGRTLNITFDRFERTAQLESETCIARLRERDDESLAQFTFTLREATVMWT